MVMRETTTKTNRVRQAKRAPRMTSRSMEMKTMTPSMERMKTTALTMTKERMMNREATLVREEKMTIETTRAYNLRSEIAGRTLINITFQSHIA